jgi:hypothetical protein
VRRDRPEEESDFDVLLQGFGGTDQSDAGAESESPTDVDSSRESSADASAPLPTAEEKQGLFGDRHPSPADAAEPREDKDSSVESFTGFFREGFGLTHFQVQQASPEDEGSGDAGLDLRMDEAFRPYDAAAAGESAMEVGVKGGVPAEEEKPVVEEMPGSPSEEADKKEEVRPAPRHEEKWPVADSRDDETGGDELPPLSISSRRKTSPFLPVLFGVLSLALAVGAGFYLYQRYSADLGGLIPGGAKESASGAKIRTLEGTFLVNREAGELFVIRGEIFNSSSKPLSALRVQGTVYGANGSVLARRTVYCGNTFTPEEMTFRSFSGMEKTMDRQFGDALANLEIPPGKGIPFAIVFRNVPREAKDFGAEIVGLSGTRPAVR